MLKENFWHCAQGTHVKLLSSFLKFLTFLYKIFYIKPIFKLYKTRLNLRRVFINIFFAGKVSKID